MAFGPYEIKAIQQSETGYEIQISYEDSPQEVQLEIGYLFGGNVDRIPWDETSATISIENLSICIDKQWIDTPEDGDPMQEYVRYTVAPVMVVKQ